MAPCHGGVLCDKLAYESIIIEVSWVLCVTVYMLWFLSYYAANLNTFYTWVSYRKADVYTALCNQLLEGFFGIYSRIKPFVMLDFSPHRLCMYAIFTHKVSCFCL